MVIREIGSDQTDQKSKRQEEVSSDVDEEEVEKTF
jgi:hypothetical protein